MPSGEAIDPRCGYLGKHSRHTLATSESISICLVESRVVVASLAEGIGAGFEFMTAAAVVVRHKYGGGPKTSVSTIERNDSVFTAIKHVALVSGL